MYLKTRDTTVHTLKVLSIFYIDMIWKWMQKKMWQFAMLNLIVNNIYDGTSWFLTIRIVLTLNRKIKINNLKLHVNKSKISMMKSPFDHNWPCLIGGSDQFFWSDLHRNVGSPSNQVKTIQGATISTKFLTLLLNKIYQSCSVP